MASPFSLPYITFSRALPPRMPRKQRSRKEPQLEHEQVLPLLRSIGRPGSGKRRLKCTLCLHITFYHFFMLLLAVIWRGILAVHLHVLVSPLFWLNFSHKRQTKDPEDPRSSAKATGRVVAKFLPTVVMSHAIGHGVVIICHYGRT